MKRSSLLTGFIASAGLLISAAANASIVVTLGGAPAGDGSGLVSSFAPTTFDMSSLGKVPTFSGDPVLFTSGSSPGLYAAPYLDGGVYAAVGSIPPPGTPPLTSLPAGPNYYVG